MKTSLSPAVRAAMRRGSPRRLAYCGARIQGCTPLPAHYLPPHQELEGNVKFWRKTAFDATAVRGEKKKKKKDENFATPACRWKPSSQHPQSRQHRGAHVGAPLQPSFPPAGSSDLPAASLQTTLPPRAAEPMLSSGRGVGFVFKAWGKHSSRQSEKLWENSCKP